MPAGRGAEFASALCTMSQSHMESIHNTRKKNLASNKRETKPLCCYAKGSTNSHVAGYPLGLCFKGWSKSTDQELKDAEQAHLDLESRKIIGPAILIP